MIINSLKRLLRPVLFFGGFPFLKIAYRRVVSHSRIFILMYHRVDYQTAPLFEIVVPPPIFEKQINFLRQHYEIIDFSDLKEIRNRRTIERDLVVLTFDDGYRDNYTHAFPVLRKYDVPATVFLATGYIGTDKLLWYDKLAWMFHANVSIQELKNLIRGQLLPELTKDVDRFHSLQEDEQSKILRSIAARIRTLSPAARDVFINRLTEIWESRSVPSNGTRAMLNWEEVKEMSSSSISFGCHTRSHPFLSSLSEQQARREIFESKLLIESHIKKPVTVFAYPYGKAEDYRSGYIFSTLKDSGFEYACSTRRGSESFPIDHPLELRRRGVAPHPYLFL